jgi:hypothetical protein
MNPAKVRLEEGRSRDTLSHERFFMVIKGKPWKRKPIALFF